MARDKRLDGTDCCALVPGDTLFAGPGDGSQRAGVRTSRRLVSPVGISTNRATTRGPGARAHASSNGRIAGVDGLESVLGQGARAEDSEPDPMKRETGRTSGAARGAGTARAQPSSAAPGPG